MYVIVIFRAKFYIMIAIIITMIEIDNKIIMKNYHSPFSLYN